MWYTKHMCDWLLLKVAAAICCFCPPGFFGLNCKGPPGCWQSLYLSADSMLHSQTRLFDSSRTHLPSPLGVLSPDSSKICTWNHKTPRTITETEGEDLLLTTPVLKHQKWKRSAVNETSNVWTSKHGNVCTVTASFGVYISRIPHRCERKSIYLCMWTGVKENCRRINIDLL